MMMIFAPAGMDMKIPCFFSQELAELVHKIHLLCLLGRGRLIDTACNDPLIQVISRFISFFIYIYMKDKSYCGSMACFLVKYYKTKLVKLD